MTALSWRLLVRSQGTSTSLAPPIRLPACLCAARCDRIAHGALSNPIITHDRTYNNHKQAALCIFDSIRSFLQRLRMLSALGWANPAEFGERHATEGGTEPVNEKEVDSPHRCSSNSRPLITLPYSVAIGNLPGQEETVQVNAYESANRPLR